MVRIRSAALAGADHRCRRRGKTKRAFQWRPSHSKDEGGNSLIRLFAIAGISAVVCCLLTALTIAFARQRKWVFEPRSDRWARKPVAKFGGVPIILTLLAAAALLHLPIRLQVVVA